MLQDGMPEEQESMLASRALEEAGERVVLVAVDQRGSKPLERLLRKADAEVFGSTFAILMEALPEVAPNQYGSHVLESSIASWTDRLGAEAEASRPSTEPVLKLCRTLKQDGGWPPLVDDACATHVVRALILALGGYVPTPQDKGKANNARGGFLPERKVQVPDEVATCRRELAAEVVSLLRSDEQLCLSQHASPVVQLLLRVLRDRGDRALVAEACSAIIGAAPRPVKLSKERLDALANSAPGSRVLEAVLQTASAQAVSNLFSGYFRQRLRALSRGEAGEFGAYLAHRVADGLADEPQLASALAEVDFAACLSLQAPAPQQAIVPKFLEACLRLRVRLKEAAGQVFRVFGVHESKEHHRVWSTLLALEDVGGPAGLLRQPGERRGKAEEPRGEEGEEAVPVADVKLRPLPSAGSQILATLLRFPVEAVQPLNGGLPKLCENRELLGALAREARTARVLEAALKPTSALAPKLRLRLTRAFKGMLGALGPHPVGGWVVVAAWKCSLGDTALRQAFVEELLAVEDALRAENFAVWKVCGLNQAKTRGEEWEKQQSKASKTQRLFGELIEGGDVEAAKAAAEARRRAEEQAADREAALLADPLVAGLLPAPAAEDMDDEAGTPEGPAVEEGAAEDLKLGKGKRGKKRKVKQAPAPEKPSGEGAPEPGAEGIAEGGAAAAAGGDEALKQALQLIAGRTDTRSARKKRRKAAAVAAAPEGGAGPAKKRRKLAFS